MYGKATKHATAIWRSPLPSGAVQSVVEKVIFGILVQTKRSVREYGKKPSTMGEVEQAAMKTRTPGDTVN